METTKIKYIIIASMAAFFISTGCERFHHLPPEKRLDKIAEFMKKELDLKENQYQTLLGIKEEIKKKHKETRKPPFWFEEKYLKQLENNTLNKEEIKNLVKEFHTNMLQNRLFEVDKIHAFIQSLDDKQRKELADLIRKYRERIKKRFPQEK